MMLARYLLAMLALIFAVRWAFAAADEEHKRREQLRRVWDAWSGPVPCSADEAIAEANRMLWRLPKDG